MPTIITTHNDILSLIDMLETGKRDYLIKLLEIAPQFKGLQFGQFAEMVNKVIKEDRPKTTVSAKTLSNDIGSARTLVVHYGSAKKALVAIDARNASAKRMSLSAQALANELVPPAHSVTPTPKKNTDPAKARIDAAVAAGIITAAQAAKMLALSI